MQFADLASSIEQFIRHLTDTKRLSPHTVSAYASDLNQFQQYINKSVITGKNFSLDTTLARNYLNQLRSAGLSTKSLQRKLSSIRVYCDYVIEQRPELFDTKLNPVADIKIPKTARKLPKVLDVDQINYLLDQAKPDASTDFSEFIQFRDSAMMETFYSSGLRLAELTALNLTHIDLNQAQLMVTGKGNKQRVLPLGNKAIIAIKDWLRARKLIANEDEQALFISRKGTRLSRRAIQLRVKQIAAMLREAENLHPHMLRHSFASHMLESSSDLRAVQELLGHADLSTTQVYTHLNFQQLAEVYDSAHPKSRRKNSKAS